MNQQQVLGSNPPTISQQLNGGHPRMLEVDARKVRGLTWGYRKKKWRPTSAVTKPRCLPNLMVDYPSNSARSINSHSHLARSITVKYIRWNF